VQIFGIPDRRFGEVICAWIKLSQDGRLNEAELVSFCQQRIAHYKIPAHIRFVDRFPMTVTGKIQKFVMRQTMIEELELEEIKTA